MEIVYSLSHQVDIPSDLSEYYLLLPEEFELRRKNLLRRQAGREYAENVIENHRKKNSCNTTSLFTISACSFFFSCLSKGLPTDSTSSGKEYVNAQNEAINRSIEPVICGPRCDRGYPYRYICGCAGSGGIHCCYCEQSIYAGRPCVPKQLQQSPKCYHLECSK